MSQSLNMKQLWVITGGNGSGKSTFYDRYLKNHGLSFVNADKIAKEISDETNSEVIKAAQRQALAACEQKLSNEETFCFETVFSHESKLDLIKKAKGFGYEVNLVFIHLSFSQLNVAPVYQRVRSGGHDVPNDKIESRIPRTLVNIKLALTLVDNAALVDNSSAEDPFKTVVRIKNGKVLHRDIQLPSWAEELILDL